MSKHKNDSKSQKEKNAFSASPENAVVPSAETADLRPGGEGRTPETPASAQPEVRHEAGAEVEALSVELEAARGEIAALKAEVEELNEKYLRKLADEVNFRKRMLREKEETQKYAVASLLGDLIPILDDFDRALAAASTAKSFEQLDEGVVLIKKQLSQMLENKYALTRFGSKGTPFDPNRHEALFAEPADVEEPMVADEYLPGYALNDRVLRTAKVRVKIPGPKKQAASPAASAEKAEDAPTVGGAGSADTKSAGIESAGSAGQS